MLDIVIPNNTHFTMHCFWEKLFSDWRICSLSYFEGKKMHFLNTSYQDTGGHTLTPGHRVNIFYPGSKAHRGSWSCTEIKGQIGKYREHNLSSRELLGHDHMSRPFVPPQLTQGASSLRWLYQANRSGWIQGLGLWIYTDADSTIKATGAVCYR